MRLRSLPGHKYLMNALLISGVLFCNCLTSSAQNNNAPAPPSGAANRNAANRNAAAQADTQPAAKTDGAQSGAGAETSSGKPEVVAVYGNLALYNLVQVHVENLPELLKDVKNLSEIILHLNGYPLEDLPVSRLSTEGPDSKILIYELRRSDNEEQQKSWNALLGAPMLFPSPAPKRVYVSVGPKNKPIESAVGDYKLRVVSPVAYWVFIVAFICVAAALVYLAMKSDLLRDPGPDPKEEDKNGVIITKRKPYSLARTQMALWFFFILASFIFIWLVSTSLTSLTGTVIGLMGISAGTGLAAAMIDSNKRGAIDNQKTELDNKRKALQADIASLEAKTGAVPPPANLADLQASLAKKQESLAQVEADLAKLSDNTKPMSSHGFLTDILSDDNGVSFHRFQIFAWTLALIIIFIASVYKVLSMPNFDGSLLALMGISSGTYLGFKIPEPRTPPEDQTPAAKPDATETETDAT